MSDHLPFLPFLSFRKPLTGQGDKVLVSDAWNCKRFLVNREHFFEVLCYSFANKPFPEHLKSVTGPGLVGSVEISVEDKKEIQHWWDRGWHPALDFYLWSRYGHYCDMHDTTKTRRREVIENYLKTDEPPLRLKPDGCKIELKKPQEPMRKASLAELLLKRQTLRRYTACPIPLNILSALLWYGFEETRCFRSRPISDPTDYLKSMGSAFDFYLVIYDVDDVTPGVYYYDIVDHTLALTNAGNFRREMLQILRKMPAPATATCTIIMVADFAQYQWRYRHERALRHLYFESGRIAQKALITAMHYNFGTLVTPAQMDSKTIELLSLDQTRQCPIYTITVGPDGRYLHHK